ncbi:MAG: transglutaminase domain-containing protein [Methanomicrobiales archaeon]|nr:transglutaminase domain-containing protein [Methanomicrobiales archaeon]
MMKLSVITALLLIISCSISYADINGDELFKSGLDAFNNHNFEKSIDFFNQSIIVYDEEKNLEAARNAHHMKNRATWMLVEMVYNITQAREVLRSSYPNLSEEERERYLLPGESIQMISDGQVRFFIGIANNAAYHNISILKEISRSKGQSEGFDELYPVITADSRFNGPYGNPKTFQANNTLSIPREYLPDLGTLQVWLPLPIELESQKDISVNYLEPAEYVKSEPITNGDHGQVYFEIPLSEMNGPFLNVSAGYQFTVFERRHKVDPERISPYDKSTKFYPQYTRSQPNIKITPEISDLAKEIVGDEMNPYRMAEKIYWYILDTYPYSTVPHTYLAAAKIPESNFMYETGYGDCGTQSMFFCALCRSLGIPARSAGGYQLIPGLAGPHFWAEFYLPEYGWIPVDITIAGSADSAFDKPVEDLERYKAYFFGNMDPYRYTIQNDVDIPVSPDPENDIIFTMVHQAPVVVCKESWEDVELIGMGYRTITFSEVSTLKNALNLL